MNVSTGIVIRSTGSWYTVKSNNQFFNCRLRKKFKLKNLNSTNPIAVGDIVKFVLDKIDGHIIVDIEERKNCLLRRAKNLTRQVHIIAANIDLALLVVTLAYPRTYTGFIDRFLASAEAYNVKASLLWNKIDIYDAKLMHLVMEYSNLYSNIGYHSYLVSAKTGKNLEQIKEVLKDKKTLLFGHSGVGKSTLINALIPNLNLKTKEISYYYKKGKHVTSYTEMFQLPFGGYIIDTPGVNEFELADFKPEELSHWFPEMRKILKNCKFSNCTHTHEPLCAVKAAVENSQISKERYINYLNILNKIEQQPAKWE